MSSCDRGETVLLDKPSSETRQIQIEFPVLERVQTVHCLWKGFPINYVVQSAQCCCVWNRRSSY